MKSISFQKTNCVNVYDHGAFDIVLKDTGIYRCFPAIDGARIQPKSVKVASRGDQVTVTYSLKNLDLSLSFFGEKDRLTVKPKIRSLKGLKDHALTGNSGGRHPQALIPAPQHNTTSQ